MLYRKSAMLIAIGNMLSCSDSNTAFHSRVNDNNTLSTLSQSESETLCEDIVSYFAEHKRELVTGRCMTNYTLARGEEQPNADECHRALNRCNELSESLVSTNERCKFNACLGTVANLEACTTDTVSSIQKRNTQWCDAHAQFENDLGNLPSCKLLGGQGGSCVYTPELSFDASLE